MSIRSLLANAALRAAKGILGSDQVPTAERARAYAITRFSPIRGLVPEMLAAYLDEFRRGDFSHCPDLWDQIIERDDIVSNVVGKRLDSVSGLAWEIITQDDTPEAARHQQALLEFYNHLTVSSAVEPDIHGEVGLLVRQMAGALGHKWAIHNIVWQPKPGMLSAQCVFCPLSWFTAREGNLLYLPEQSAFSGVPMDPASWLISAGPGLMIATSVAYIYKNLSLKDWVIYCQRHGVPGIIGKTPAAKGTTEWNDMVSAVEAFAADFAMVCNSDAQIEKVEVGAAGTLPFPGIIERMDRAIAALWRGADLSTLSAGQGQGQGASLQGDESSLIQAADARWISETLSRQIDRRVIAWHFGPDVLPLAFFRLVHQAPKDQSAEIAIDQALHQMGAPIAIQDLLARYGRQMPAPDAVLLPPPAAPVAPFNSFANSSPRGPITRAFPGAGSPPFNPAPPSLSNAQSAEDDFLRTSLASLAQSTAADLQPLRDRIATLLQLEAPAEFRAALETLRSDLPALQAAINQDPAAAAALQDIIATSLVSGYAEAEAERPTP